MLRLAMAAGRCPGCGEAREPGVCEGCGAQVPASDELSEVAVARRKALGSLLERAEELCQGFDAEVSPGAKITGDQLAGAFEQSGIFARLDEAELSCQRLSGLDFDDESALGTSVRKAISKELALVEEVRELCLELSSFEVSTPQPEIHRELVGAGGRTAEMLMRFLETVCALTIPEVRAGEERLQAALSQGSSYRELPARVQELFGSDDLDTRISLATGRPGSYLDPEGFLSPGQVFGAFAGEEEPHEQLAEAAAAYFEHLLPGGVEPAGGVILVLAAVTLCSLDRPLLAHRCAKDMAELVGRAAAIDAKAVEATLTRSVEEGPKLFAAASRVQAGLRLLCRVSELEEIDEELLLREVMGGYLEIAESAFRSHAWAALRLQEVVEGKEASDAGPPTLGSLEQRLAASNSGLARALGQAADSELRNATGHAQYRWDAEAEEVEDLETHRRWNIEELAEATEALGDSVVGVDAGYLCGVLAAGVDLEAQGAPDLRIRELLLESAFAIAGYELVELSQDAATVAVRAKAETGLPSLMGAVASQSALVADVDAFRVRDSDSGRVLVDVPAERMRAATRGPEVIRDLELVQCYTDSEIRTGSAASSAAYECLVVQAKVVAVTSLQRLALEGASTDVIAGIRRRAELVLGFLDGHPEIDQQAAQSARRRLQAVIAGTYPLQRGEPKALPGFLRRVQATFAWADRQNVSWPPE